MIWLTLLFILLLWFPMNIQHEGMHGLTAKLFGATEVKLYPFPKFKDGKLQYFAYMTYRLEEPISSAKRGLIACAPQLTNTIIMTLTGLALLLCNIPGWLFSLMLALFIVNFIDGAVNLSSLFKREGDNDAWTALEKFKFKLHQGRAIVIMWYVIFLNLGFLILF